ncbi:MAG: efflux RND transporter periplasmic adaptor subunit [Holophagaceae bacterium]|nr:efflux RND transporter periplasmic adaptor subunit [Holophagaceae bacterium]
MKSFLSTHGRNLALAGVLMLLLGLLAYVALRAGPLAPVPVTLVTVESRGITPALFGIGTVEARYLHKIGPTFAGRVKRVEVQPGDHVKMGQLLGEMDPVDLDDKINAQDASLKRAEASVLAVEAQIQEVSARKSFAETQAKRYEQLLIARSVSEEAFEAKRQESQVAQASLAAARANLDATRQELARVRAERDGLHRQRTNLLLVSPVDGLVTRRDADPGTTVIAGQTVVEVVEPGSVWINVRFDQQRALGLRANLPAQIVLRSQAGDPLAGRVSRIEPHADAVTEEVLAKVEFNQRPQTLPPIGELAEVTVALAAQKPMPVVPNASVQRVDGHLGVWVVQDGSLRFAPVKTGATDLEGQVQILEGLSGGERVVVYSKKALDSNSRIKIVDRIVGKSS